MSDNNQDNVYEMLWDCQFCGTKGNLGLTHRYCPNCGAPQDPDSRYFPSDEEKVAVKDHKFVGVDVTCPSCDTLNSAAAEFCGNCAAPLTEGAKAKRLADQVRGDGEKFESSGSRDLVKEKFEAEQRRVGNLPPVEKPKRQRGSINLAQIAVIVLVLAALAGGAFLMNWTQETQVVVTGHDWERSINIQEYQDFTTRSWRDSPPVGDNVSIRLGSCTREQRSTRQIPDGEECTTRRVDQGDGTFREVVECRTTYRTEPVYDDMCTWTGQRWESDRTARESGTGLTPAPIWPNVTLNCEGQRRVGCERESGRNERYTVIYEGTENDREFRCDFSQQKWESTPIESIWAGQVRVVDGGGLRCDELTRAN